MASNSNPENKSASAMRALLALACVVVIVAGLRAAAEFFIPVMLGLFIALLSLPILNFLHHRGLPRPLALLATIAIDLLILGAIVFVGLGVIGDFQEETPKYAKRLREQASDFSERMDAYLVRFEKFWQNLEVREEPGEPRSEEGPADRPSQETLEETPAVAFGPEATDLVPEITFRRLFDLYFDTDRLVGFVGQVDVVSRITSLTTKSFFALIVMIFVLAEAGGYLQKVREVNRIRGPDLGRYQSISRDIQKYLAIKTGASVATGMLAMFACKLFGIDFPILWGLVAFLFNYVPAIGSIIAAIPPVLLALILYGFWPAMGVLGCYLAINIVIGNFLEPMFLGDRFGISTLIVVISVLFWGFIWGPVGMLLAVPLTMLLKVMLDSSREFHWIAVMMGKSAGDGVAEAKRPNTAPEEETAD